MVKYTTEVIMNVVTDDATAVFPSSLKKDPVMRTHYHKLTTRIL